MCVLYYIKTRDTGSVQWYDDDTRSDDTKVAGKKVHNIFFESGNDPSGIKSMKDRFEQECVRYKQVTKFICMYVLCIVA